VIAYNLLQSIHLLARGSEVFALRCVAGLEANREKCQANLEQSLAMCTALVPVIGYDRAAQIAKTAYETNRTIRDVAREVSGLNENQLNELLDAAGQTQNC
jgi:fumarate hydratase, class II